MQQQHSFRVILTSFLVLTEYVHGDGELYSLQILHTNDMHARFLETDVYCGSCPDEYVQKNKCYGGFSRVKSAANNAIEWAKRQNHSSIFLNAGDTFQGTPYYTLYKWQISADMMNSLDFDAVCLGNHEFDDGIDNLVEYLNHLNAPMVCANFNLTSEPRLENVKNLRKSKVLNVDGKKIGIIGYITPDTMKISNTENLQIFDEIPIIRKEAKRLKSEGVDIIIGLGHSGFDMDKIIAKEVEDVNIIVGGHSHDLLFTPKDTPPSTEQTRETYPYVVTQKSGKKVPIVQAYAYAKYLGRLLVTFDSKNNVISATGNPILLDHTVKKDPEIDRKAESWASKVKKQLKSIVGYTRVFLEKSTFVTTPPEFESNIANLITDSMVDTAVERAKKTNMTTWTNATMAFYMNGGIRSRIDNKKNHGAITLEDLLTLLPFESNLYECSFYGANIKSALELSVRTFDVEEFKHLPYFLHFSGMRVVYNLKNEPGKRVEYAEVLCLNCTIPKYEPLMEHQNYVAVLSDFIMAGGDFFDMLKVPKNQCIKLNVTDTKSLINYVEKNKVVYPAIEGRFTLMGLNQQSSSSSIAKISTSVLFSLVLLSTMVNVFTSCK